MASQKIVPLLFRLYRREKKLRPHHRQLKPAFFQIKYLSIYSSNRSKEGEDESEIKSNTDPNRAATSKNKSDSIPKLEIGDDVPSKTSEAANDGAQDSSFSSSSSDSSDSSDSDDEVQAQSKIQTPQQAAALAKLNSLLLSMSKFDKPDQSQRPLSLDLAKPTKTFERKKKVEEKILEKKKKPEEKVKEEFDPLLVDAVKAVAQDLGGDKEKTESELLQKLREHGAQTAAGKMGNINLDNVFVGMKIDRTKPSVDPRQVRRSTPSSWAAQMESGTEKTNVKLTAEKGQPRFSSVPPKIDLFGSGYLNVFSKVALESGEKKALPELKIWDDLDKHELQQLISHQPKNAFEEMIMWTEQQKMWQYPIDNEQGLEDEAKVGFHEHIFLEPLLEDGFPKKGPVRHFMELVTTGLSKNPYLTVKEKHEHIDWFRKYFKDKEKILAELGIA